MTNWCGSMGMTRLTITSKRGAPCRRATFEFCGQFWRVDCAFLWKWFAPTDEKTLISEVKKQVTLNDVHAGCTRRSGSIAASKRKQ